MIGVDVCLCGSGSLGCGYESFFVWYLMELLVRVRYVFFSELVVGVSLCSGMLCLVVRFLMWVVGSFIILRRLGVEFMILMFGLLMVVVRLVGWGVCIWMVFCV